ncbi:hypothetical protein D3C73_1042200 [compost metagenome]
MAIRRFAQGTRQQLQLLFLQIPRHRPRYGRVEQGDPPVADVHDRIQQCALHRRLGHDLRLIVVTGNPAGWRVQGSSQVAKLLVGLQGTVLGNIAAGDDQVDPWLLLPNQFDDLLQAVPRVHAQQRTIGLGKQMAVGQLHQQRRIGGGQCGYARQDVLPGLE